MASLNLVQVIGNVGKDPEMRYTPGGQAVTQFSVAVNRRWQKDGEWQEETEWFAVTTWSQLAERLADSESGSSIRKGDQVYVQGRSQTRSWEDDGGNRRYKTELVADKVQKLGRKADGEGRRDDEPPKPAARGGDDFADLPF